MFHVEHSAIKGRGAQSGQVPTRFGLAEREVDGDWRDYVAALDGPPVKLRTTVTEERPKSILTFNQSPDVPFDRSINAYRGCEHGCVYCFARPTHAYHDLSPGLDFETRLFAKPEAAALLRKTLAKRGYQPRPLALGTNTDPYQPIERDYRITRQILEVLAIDAPSTEDIHHIVNKRRRVALSRDGNVADAEQLGPGLSIRIVLPGVVIMVLTVRAAKAV